ncbi:aldolase [Allopusillimonas soli]|uniref:Aldolase n=1 Tax=Allopusillimonas soli TaxID=659016 RepID=A0A853FBA2_9BURK|nr:aldolase [Allopusillimonas soli]NYT37247.1 aldolase [Allopusillimonas soli]TEA74753.1 aldolase [Allopusillimonas soli]
MSDTMELSKDELVTRAQAQMQARFDIPQRSVREKLAITSRVLYDGGHDSGLAGQITARGDEPGTYYTQRLGLGFDEISVSNILLVNEDLEILEGHGMPNPANRFHSWIYRVRPDVQCIVHTHPLHAAALSMLEVPLAVSHMDNCPLYDDCAFLPTWPGVPVGNEEGETIAAALGDKRAILLAHHGMLVAATSIEEACVLALQFERTARMQLLAMGAGEIKPIAPELGREAHDWILRPRRSQIGFEYYARKALARHPDLLR